MRRCRLVVLVSIVGLSVLWWIGGRADSTGFRPGARPRSPTAAAAADGPAPAGSSGEQVEDIARSDRTATAERLNTTHAPHLRGRVVRTDGTPRSGATVELHGRAQWVPYIPGPGLYRRVEGGDFAATTVTDEHGLFEFAKVPPGVGYWVLATTDSSEWAQCRELDLTAPRDVGDVVLRDAAVLQGTIRDHSSRALAGVRLELGTVYGSVRSDAHGRFRVVTTPGRHELSVDLAGFVLDSPKALWVGEEGIAALDVRLRAAWTLHGRVRNTTGEAIEGATVQVVGGASARTGADGAFEIGGNSDDDVGLRVDAHGYCEVRIRSCGLDDLPLAVVMQSADMVEGTAFDAAGRPLWLDELAFGEDWPGRSSQPQWERVEFSQSEPGAFRFPCSGVTSIRVRGTVAGYGPALSSYLTIRDETGATARLEFGRGREQRVVVIDERGAPVPQARVRAYSENWRNEDGAADAEAETDGTGIAVLRGLPEGSSRIGVTHRDYAGGGGVEAAPPYESLTVTLVRRGTIAGRVLDRDGRPAARQFLHVPDPDRGLESNEERVIVTEADGRFLSQGYRPGRVLVRLPIGTVGKAADESKPARSWVHLLAASEPEETTIVIQPMDHGTLRGTLLWNGVAREFAEFDLWSADRGQRNRYRPVSGVGGKFGADFVEPGKYRVRFWDTVGEPEEPLLLEVVEGHNERVLQVETGALELRVVDAVSELPVEGARVELRLDGDRQQAWTTRRDGRISAHDVYPREYEVRVEARGFQRASHTVTVKEREINTVQLRLTRGGWVEVLLGELPTSLAAVSSMQAELFNAAGERVDRHIVDAPSAEQLRWIPAAAEVTRVELRLIGANRRHRFLGSSEIETATNGNRYTTVLLERSR